MYCSEFYKSLLRQVNGRRSKALTLSVNNE